MSLLIIGGSRCAAGVRPPTGSISFVFAYISPKSVCVGGWCPPTGRRPPNGKSWIRHCLYGSTEPGQYKNSHSCPILMDSSFKLIINICVI